MARPRVGVALGGYHHGDREDRPTASWVVLSLALDTLLGALMGAITGARFVGVVCRTGVEVQAEPALLS